MKTWPLLRGVAWIIVLPVSDDSKVHPPKVRGDAGPVAGNAVNVPAPVNA